MELQDIKTNRENGGVILNDKTIVTFVNTDGWCHMNDDESKQKSINRFLKMNYCASQRKNLKIEKLRILTAQSRRIISGDMMTSELKVIYWEFKFMDEKHINWCASSFNLRNKGKLFKGLDILGSTENPQMLSPATGHYVIRPTMINFDEVFIINGEGCSCRPHK